ncbi:MAG: hypothetical protein U5N86_03365 [Planctomycetota bacterium]|nr:hypothetical protein [Planctomycetota bacterium]
MKIDLKRFLLIALAAFILMPAIGMAEDDEVDPNLPGDPDCPACHGTGKIEYDKKAGKIKFIEYCHYKDKGKRCPVLIGGWEPCLRCEDFPGMQPIFDEHEKLVQKLRGIAGGYLQQVQKTGAPLPNLAPLLSRHGRLYTDVPHSSTHNLIIAHEEAFNNFSEDFEMGGEGSAWDERFRYGFSYIHLTSKDVYLKNAEWFYDSKYIGHSAKSMGKKRLMGCAAIGFLNSRLSYLSQQGLEHDERGYVDSCTTQLLSLAFVSKDMKRSPFTAWLTEGVSAYYQHVVRGGVSWYTVAYGMGTRQDKEKWQRFEDWKGSLADANKVPRSKFDERTGSWKGLIPLDQLIGMRITNIPHQGLAQAWSLVHFLMGTGFSSRQREEQREKFKDFLTQVGSGVEQEEAFKNAYGYNKLSTLENRYRSWLRRFCAH